MSSETSEEPATGEHLLGPHVVGQRVVIRRVVRGETGPTGGPALTDTLGVAQSWDDAEVVVRREDGVAVAIRIADIVSGKPVPPRPSVHHRLSARACEEHTLALWPQMERVPLLDGVASDWVLRCDPAPVGRPLKRANSCLAMGEPGTSYDEALAAVVAFYTERDRDPLIQVEAGSDAERALLERGWQPLAGGEAEFRVGSLAKARRARRSLRASVDAEATLLVDGTHAVVEVRDASGTVLASGRGSLHRDWLALHGLHVAPEHRRRGLAGLVLDELFDWAGETGATTVWLHVEADNTAALALYGALGLVSHHTARYLTPG
ncbi:GNAT family N-acetyltransferase [Nocardioides pacificus]